MLVTKAKQKLVAIAGGAALMYAATASAEYGLNLPRGVTSISRDAYDLHMLVFCHVYIHRQASQVQRR